MKESNKLDIAWDDYATAALFCALVAVTPESTKADRIRARRRHSSALRKLGQVAGTKESKNRAAAFALVLAKKIEARG